MPDYSFANGVQNTFLVIDEVIDGFLLKGHGSFKIVAIAIKLLQQKKYDTGKLVPAFFELFDAIDRKFEAPFAVFVGEFKFLKIDNY